MSFLTSTWSYLPFANYKVDPKLLIPYVPKGTQLDLHHGAAYISLVGLRFENTRLLRFPVPFHINFSEINLRFYVKQPDSGRRGVVFIKEIVDKPMITLVANKLYHERYQTMPVTFDMNENPEKIQLTYRWKPVKWQEFGLSYHPTPLAITGDSNEQFILERYFGYSEYDKKTTYEYEVRHASWEHFKVIDYDIKVDFKETYGDAFEFLNHQQPESIMMARGSRISIENKRKL